MANNISRRAFVTKMAVKYRGLGQILVSLLVAVLFAWLIVVVLQFLCGMTLQSWMLIGCIALLTVLVHGIRWWAEHVYVGLSPFGNALCTSAGEIARIIAFIVIGIYVWDAFNNNEMGKAISMSVVGVLSLGERVHERYVQTLSEQSATGQSGQGVRQ